MKIGVVRLGLGLAVGAVLLLLFGGAGSADPTINFEDLTPGTVVTNQYADAGGSGQGVVFGPLPGGASSLSRPVIQSAPSQAHSGSQVADITCNQDPTQTCNEGIPTTPDTTGTFSVPRSRVSVYVGYLGSPAVCPAGNPNNACAYVTLAAFDSSGSPVGTPATARVVQGRAMQLISVFTPSAQIVGFEIKARDADAGKQIGIDDLSFDTPATPAPPDFTLTPAATAINVVQGQSATDAITIGRLSGSTGNVLLSASGLPAGVQAQFAPNPGGGAASTLTLTADSNAPLTTGATATITGTPQSSSAGTTAHSFTLSVGVVASSLPPGPPTAAINAPADGRIVKLRAFVATRFSCSDNAGGPGIASCVDSRGARGGTGRLDTRRLGRHTYTVTATSSDGQTGTATIQYTVTRSGRGVRPVVPLPAPLLNAAVQPCALIPCLGNPGPRTQLMNTLGPPEAYCTMYHCSPMDLIPTNGLDYNLFPYNPDWARFTQTGQPPDALSLCDEYNGGNSLPYLGSSPCTSQPVTYDNPNIGSLAWGICRQGRHPRDAYHGHVNYWPATYQGTLKWFEKSPVGADDEYSLDLNRPLSALDGVLAGNNFGNSIHIEFDTDETVDHFDDNAWWKSFHDSVDNVGSFFFDPNVPLPDSYVTGHLAVVTGLVGIDTVHGAAAELHPVYSIAIQTDRAAALAGSTDRWAFFARNFGNEGYCSRNGHPLPDGPLRMLIPWLPGATGVRVDPNSDVWSNIDPQVIASVLPNVGVLLTFPLTPASNQPLYWGTIDLRWTIPTALRSADAALVWSPRLSAVFGVPAGAAGQSTARDANGGESKDVEGLVGKLWKRLPRGKRIRALSRLPHPVVALPGTKRRRVVMAPPPSGLLPPPGPFVFPRLAPAVVKRTNAEAGALCLAYGNHVPGLPKAACSRSKR